MVLFRHISLRERWARYWPGVAASLAAAFVAVACLLVLDSFV
jgi:hypothetical protein